MGWVIPFFSALRIEKKKGLTPLATSPAYRARVFAETTQRSRSGAPSCHTHRRPQAAIHLPVGHREGSRCARAFIARPVTGGFHLLPAGGRASRMSAAPSGAVIPHAMPWLLALPCAPVTLRAAPTCAIVQTSSIGSELRFLCLNETEGLTHPAVASADVGSCVAKPERRRLPFAAIGGDSFAAVGTGFGHFQREAILSGCRALIRGVIVH